MAIETFFILFAKSIGFFCLSPLFRYLQMPSFIRFALALIISILVTPAMDQIQIPAPFFLVNLLKEGALGYLLGFIFSTLFEAAALAGEVVGSMMGFSLTEIFDPVQNSNSPLMSRFFTIVMVALFFSLDLHHSLIKILFEGHSINFNTILDATSFLFSQMLRFALIPFSLLAMILVALAVAARLFPDFPIMWTGFPIELMVGLIAIAIAINFFPEIINHGFSSLLDLLKSDIIPPLNSGLKRGL